MSSPLGSLVLVAILALAAPASAFTVVGQNYGADVTAEVDLSWDGTDTLTITIENTANAAAVTTAVITGFALNIPTGLTVSGFTAAGTLDDASWEATQSPGNAPGGYVFELAGISGPNIAGGNPNDGFGIGSTATFTFTFTGAIAGLTTADFLGELEDGASGPSDFGVRFQSIPTGAGSDFALHVPAPGLAVLLGSTLPALLFRRCRA